MDSHTEYLDSFSVSHSRVHQRPEARVVEVIDMACMFIGRIQILGYLLYYSLMTILMITKIHFSFIRITLKYVQPL